MAVTGQKTAVSRADLLRLMAQFGDSDLASLAPSLGYQAEAEQAETVMTGSVDAPRPLVTGSATGGPGPGDAATDSPPTRQPARFFRILSHESRDLPPGQSAFQPPDWYLNTRPLESDHRPDPRLVRLPKRQPLVRWSRLWPVLQSVLSSMARSRQPDVPRLIGHVTCGRVLKRIPMWQRRAWASRICVLLDFNPRVWPLREDFNALCTALERLRGALGLELRILVGEPGHAPDWRDPRSDAIRHWRMPDPGTPLLVLSDLGMLDEGSPLVRQGWRRFGAALRSAGCRPIVLSPVPGNWNESVQDRFFDIRVWDRNSTLKPSQGAAGTLQARADDHRAAETLLGMLGPALMIEPALLRAARHLLPGALAGVAAETLVWTHADMQTEAQAVCFATPEATGKYKAAFAILEHERQCAVVDLLRKHHAHLPDSVRLVELETCESLAPGVLTEPERKVIEAWRNAMARTCHERLGSRPIAGWLLRHEQRLPNAVEDESDSASAMRAIAARARAREGEQSTLPARLAGAGLDFFLHEPEARPLEGVLVQRGNKLVLEAPDSAKPRHGYVLARTFARVRYFPDALTVITTGNATPDDQVATLLPVRELPATVLTLDQGLLGAHIDTGADTLDIGSVPRPTWAQRILHDGGGLICEVMWLDRSHMLHWGRLGDGPAWGWRGDGVLGVDAFGLYANFDVAGVNQRCRWIEPGAFQMGSPEDEPERGDDETPHPVTLTRGYWLAETACTQALWEAVMGENPSHFKEDPDNPVERVSWDDVQQFLKRLNQLVPGLEAGLPTEAQWEYACRAGTQTPFSFGTNFTPEQVNYDGNFPYAGGKKGLYRKKTVPVKSLPPNPWGFYEMHGNVLEWCMDWYGEYPTGPQSDPQGPPTGASRVLRGGSRDDLGRYCRSAFRRRNGPDERSAHIGFRLAPGQAAVSTGEEAGRPSGGRERAERGGSQPGGSAAGAAKAGGNKNPETGKPRA